MSYEDYVKEQVSKRDWRIIQELKDEGRINLDTGILTHFWTDFVKEEERRKTEIPFLLDQLKEYQCPKVFNSCLGSGTTTIGLIKAGIRNVVSNEIDDVFLRIAKKEAKKHGVRLGHITRYDWRELNEQLFDEFDCTLNLGNSLTYLFKENDQIKALNNFWKTLKSNGKLIIDKRNYAELFLKGKGSSYRWTGEVVYCGIDKVDAYPIYISQTMVIMEYRHRKNGAKLNLVLYPWDEGELKEKLINAGFRKIKVYGNMAPEYKEEGQFDPREPEFLTYVCRKI